MLAASRLARTVAVALCRAGVQCGPTPLSRARVIAAVHLHNLQLRRLGTVAKTERNQLPTEELLEKQVAGLSTDIHQKNRVYKNDVLRVLSNIKEKNFSTKSQGLLLLRCCAELLPDESAAARLALVEQVWSTLKPHTTFGIEHYNELLRCYIANNRPLNAGDFISQMSPVNPNITTYELILQAICEAGDLNQAAEVISNMKALGISATEKIFHSLIIGQGRAGNLQKIQEVLTMMKTLKVEVSVDTYVAIARAYALNDDYTAVLKHLDTAQKKGFQFQETHIMEIVKCLAVRGLNASIPKVLTYLPEEILQNPSISSYMQSVTTQLVFLNCPLAALEVYKCLPLPSFGPKDDQGLHGRSLVRDCVKASVTSSVLGHLTQDLMTSGRNPIALQSACEAALQLGKSALALEMLTRMQTIGLPLRPHYFWPILVASSKSYGEKGLMNTLATMNSMEVSPDHDTLLDYVLPYVSFSSPQNLMKKLLDCGLTVSGALTPMMHVLVSTGQVRSASELCELFEGTVDSEKLLSPLIKGYLTSHDVKSTVFVLEELSKKAVQRNCDWVGQFLCKFVTHKKIKLDKTHFIELVKALKSSELRISTSATDLIIPHLSAQDGEGSQQLKGDLEAITDERMVDESELFLAQIPHPRAMNEPSLRSHLAELEAKGMNTRGALRKLLQLYCREGDLKAAHEIVEKCRKEDVYLSAGMKAAIFDMHVKTGEMELAEQSLAELSKSFPNFTLDEFKVIDFATLMVRRNQIKKAFDLMEQQSQKRRVIGGRSIEMNCWRLLDAMAANGTPKQTQQMLNFLLQHRYCRPSNAILGPLVRVHMKGEDLTPAVNEFVRVSDQYRRTPLKHELLCRVLAAMSDGRAEDGFEVSEQTDVRRGRLVRAVLAADRKVHGASDVQLTLMSALADVGYKRSLRRLLLDPKVRVHREALLRRCERFAEERRLEPIATLAECARDLRHVDTDALYEIMLRVHQRSDDCQGALALWQRMQEDDVRPSQRFVQSLASLLKANNQPVPPELLTLLDKDTRTEELSK